MSQTNEITRVVEMTPSGRAAVATILVDGPAAMTSLSRYFHSASGIKQFDQMGGKILFGSWAGPSGEQLVVCPQNPARIEIHCHGGRAAVEKILADLESAGCEPASWQDWQRQSTVDPIEAEAVVQLARAPTQRTAHILLDQYQGALTSRCKQILAAVHSGDLVSSIRQVEALLRYAPIGQHLVSPWRVVVAGRPNVGKSSLINALLGFQRVIVFDQPGTTRDVVTEMTAIDGWPVELSDTAGLRETDQGIEQAGIAKAHRQIEAADLLVLLLDSSADMTDDATRFLSTWPDALVVASKADLLPPDRQLSPAMLPTSAATGQGIKQLIEQISARLVPSPPEAGAAIPFTAEQVDWLTEIHGCLTAGDSAAATCLLERTIAIKPG